MQVSYKYLEHICTKFVEMYTSINADNSSISNITPQKMVCLVISSLIFSLLLSLTIDLYNFIPLTAKANIHGINIMFWVNKDVIINSIPFPHSKSCHTRR